MNVVDDVLALPTGGGVRMVAIDGVDGAGKTCFADQLAAELGRCGVSVIRASVDGFHHPAEVRHRRGRSSPEGFCHDPYDYQRLTRLLLTPLREGGEYIRQVYDVHAAGQQLYLAECHPQARATVVIDNTDLTNPSAPRAPHFIERFIQRPAEPEGVAGDRAGQVLEQRGRGRKEGAWRNHDVRPART